MKKNPNCPLTLNCEKYQYALHARLAMFRLINIINQDQTANKMHCTCETVRTCMGWEEAKLRADPIRSDRALDQATISAMGRSTS